MWRLRACCVCVYVCTGMCGFASERAFKHWYILTIDTCMDGWTLTLAYTHVAYTHVPEICMLRERERERERER